MDITLSTQTEVVPVLGRLTSLGSPSATAVMNNRFSLPSSASSLPDDAPVTSDSTFTEWENPMAGGEATSFQEYYQQFTGHSGLGNAAPAQGRRYTIVRHSGSPLTHPSLKIGLAGLGSLMTATTAAFLLSDDFNTPLASSPLNYSIPAQANAADKVTLLAQSPTSVSPDVSAVALPEFSAN